MTDQEIRGVISGLHPDLEVGEMELVVCRAIAAAEREALLKACQIEGVTIKDIIRMTQERDKA